MPPVVTFYKNRQNLLREFGGLSGFMVFGISSDEPSSAVRGVGALLQGLSIRGCVRRDDK